MTVKETNGPVSPRFSPGRQSQVFSCFFPHSMARSDLKTKGDGWALEQLAPKAAWDSISMATPSGALLSKVCVLPEVEG